MNVRNDQRLRDPIDITPTTASPQSAPTARSTGGAAARPSSSSAEDAQRRNEQLPNAPELNAFIQSLRANGQEATRTETDGADLVAAIREAHVDASAQAKLDVFRKRFSGPYTIEGQSVAIPPMFRMNGGINDSNMTKHEGELRAICAKAGCSSAVLPATMGRPTPEQLVKVTQALIDAGKLPPGDAASLAHRVRQMQWTYGIGVDCAGYTEGAAAAASGTSIQQPFMGDAFSPDHLKAMKRVDVGDARPGDVIHLDPPKTERVGHNVVVYSNKVADAATIAEISARDPAAKAFMSGRGPFQVLEVDSSWGAGNGQDFGGFRRDTWVFDTSTKTWGYFDRSTHDFKTSTIGPHDEPFTGAFRPKAAVAAAAVAVGGGR